MTRLFRSIIPIIFLFFLNTTFSQEITNYNSNGYFSLLGSLSLSKQLVNDISVGPQFNYAFNEVNNNVLKPGYSFGGRYDGTIKGTNFYSLSLTANRIVSGSKYVNKYTLAPLLGDFTHYKADNRMTTIRIAVHYRKLLPIGDVNKYKFFLVLGPSIDYRLSGFSNDHVVYEKGKRILVNGDMGLEFDNKGYYVLFAHYRFGSNLSKQLVPIHINRFELGMSIKTRDLF
jgi:hypothetical protein